MLEKSLFILYLHGFKWMINHHVTTVTIYFSNEMQLESKESPKPLGLCHPKNTSRDTSAHLSGPACTPYPFFWLPQNPDSRNFHWDVHEVTTVTMILDSHPDFAPDSQAQSKSTRCRKETCNLQMSLIILQAHLINFPLLARPVKVKLSWQFPAVWGWYHPILPGNWLPSPPFQSSIRPGAGKSTSCACYLGESIFQLKICSTPMLRTAPIPRFWGRV